MLNLEKIKIDFCKNQLKEAYDRNYSDMEKHMGNIVVWAAHLALENIANCDALYHNVEHTVLVTLVGQSILEGKHLSEGGVTPRDWTHYMIALLCHDIGFVRGVCRADRDRVLATGNGRSTVEIDPESTDAALAPYHVDRSKLFIRERFGEEMLMNGVIDPKRICDYIEMTRHPIPDEPFYQDTSGYKGLVRAADYIGQLGDPYRLQKCTALFYEFEELGLNEKLGYRNPGDVREKNAKFYWDEISPYVQDALRYLRVTQDGKQWISYLHANVFGQHMDVIFNQTHPRPYPC